jgi:hypothetical protein
MYLSTCVPTIYTVYFNCRISFAYLSIYLPYLKFHLLVFLYVSVCLLHCLSIRPSIRGSTKLDNCFQIGPSLRIHAPLGNTPLQRTLRLLQNCGTHTGKHMLTGASPRMPILYTVWTPIYSVQDAKYEYKAEHSRIRPVVSHCILN